MSRTQPDFIHVTVLNELQAAHEHRKECEGKLSDSRHLHGDRAEMLYSMGHRVFNSTGLHTS